MTSTERTPGKRTRTVEIPDRTADEISNRLRGTEFETVDEYVAFALDQLLRQLDRLADDEAGRDPESSRDVTDDAASHDENDGGATDKAVSDRLESLGYL